MESAVTRTLLDRARRSAWLGLADRRTWTRLGYLAATCPMGWAWLIVLLTLLAGGIILSLVWIGIPILWLAFHIARGGARFERLAVRKALGDEIADPYRRDPEASRLLRWRVRLADPATWRDLAYLTLVLPGLGTAWLVALGSTVATTALLVSLPVTYRWFPGGQFTPLDFGSKPWVVVDSLPAALVAACVGLLLLSALPTIVKAMATAHCAVARSLLGPSKRATLGGEIAGLRRSREHSLEAARAERQRIERDLHDGAQQRLVALAMDLGMAKEKLGSDPAMAKDLVDEAHHHAKQALAELRDLARGIHPAVLSDRGLDAALSALAAQAPFAVDVTCTLESRPRSRQESTAYFVVAEALANASKHSGANSVRITVRQTDETLVVEVEDDGVGGADPRGSGLEGLAHRVASVDGVLTVSSPIGGPTTITAELPCES